MSAMLDEPLERTWYGYNPKFVARIRAKQEAAEAERKAEAQRQALAARIALLKEEAARARADILAAKEAKLTAAAGLPVRAACIRHGEYDRVLLRAIQLFGYTVQEIVSQSRARKLVMARQFVMYWAWRRSGLSMPQIGRRLNRDHTTILAGIRAYPMKRAQQGRTLRRAR